MTELAKYTFDLQGYILIKNALPPEKIQDLAAQWEIRAMNRDFYDLSFDWGEPWLSLLDPPEIVDCLNTILGGCFRLDHAFGINEKFCSAQGKLHHESAMFRRGIYYLVEKGQIHTTLVTVSYALVDIGENDGGFSCIPGSHKAAFNTPRELFSGQPNSFARQVPQKAGDAIVFTEALTHGTCVQNRGGIRRSLLLRYCPAYFQFRKPGGDDHGSDLPSVDDSLNHSCANGDLSSLPTKRQQAILSRQPYAVDSLLRNRPSPLDL